MPAQFRREYHYVSGVRTAVDIVGQGHPVLYLHGAATIEGFSFATGMAEKLSIICPHHPGMGESDDAPHISNMADMAEHYRQLLGILALEQKPHLMGFSMGGWLAVEFASRTSNLIDKVVLVAPDGLNDPRYPAVQLEQIQPDQLPSYFSHDPAIAAAFYPDATDSVAVEKFSTDREREEAIVGRLYANGNYSSAEFAASLSQIDNVTLLVWGESDRLVPAAQMSEWTKSLKNSSGVVVQNTGHLVLQESSLAVSAISDFLTSSTS